MSNFLDFLSETNNISEGAHCCLERMHIFNLSSEDAHSINLHISSVIETLNKLLQIIANPPSDFKDKENFKILCEEKRFILMDALMLLKEYKNSYENRCKEARKMAKYIPIFDGTKTLFDWKEFWDRFQFYVGNSPLKSYEKFDILCKHLDGKPKESISHLAFKDDESYDQAVKLLTNLKL